MEQESHSTIAVEDVVEWFKTKDISEARMGEIAGELCQKASKKRRVPFSDEGGPGKVPRIDLDWLHELHDKLWGREDLFDQVFRAVDLTKEDFIELQSNLHHLNPSRNYKTYLAKKEKNILETKIAFLRSRTTTHPLTINTDSLVPKVVLCNLIPAGTMDNDSHHNGAKDSKSDAGDKEAQGEEDDGEAQGGQDDGEVEGEDDDEEAKDDEDEEYSEGGDDKDGESYIEEDAAVLSDGSTPLLPCSIRYMDLTYLNLQHFDRVSQFLLIRDEWDAVIDIFNQGEKGREGGAVWTGQPGTGKTALLYYILVICIIQAQPIVFQDITGAVYTINDEVRHQMSSPVRVPGDDVFTLVDGDGASCEPDNSITLARNLRILLISSPRSRRDRRWLTQDVGDPDASYIVGPWQWDEFAITSIFLSKADITLRRLRKAAKFCGFNPRSAFLAARSAAKLKDAMEKVRNAMHQSPDIEKALKDVAGDLLIPHCAFMIYPGDERRTLLGCVVKPVSDWAQDIVFATLEPRSVEAACELYRRIEGYPPASFLGAVVGIHTRSRILT